LDEIGERIKHMNTVQQAEGYMLLIKGVMHRATNSTAAKRSFNLAIEKFQEALDSNSNSKVGSCLLLIYDRLPDDPFLLIGYIERLRSNDGLSLQRNRR